MSSLVWWDITDTPDWPYLHIWPQEEVHWRHVRTLGSPVLASTPHTEHSAAHGILFQQQQPSRQAAEIILKIGSKIRMKIFVFKSEKNIKLYTVIHI